MTQPQAGRPEADIADVVRRVRLIPEQHRSYGVPEDRAAVTYRIPAPLLARLTELGLPARSQQGRLTFDHYDLVNVSLELRLPSVWALGLRWWRSALSDAGRRRDCRVEYTFTCPDPGHPGPCRVDVLTPENGWQTAEFADPPRAVKLDFASTFQLPTRWPAVPPEITRLAREMARMTFTILPIALARDRDFSERTGLADCTTAPQWLAEEARACHVPARFSTGLAVVTPFSMRHCWTDILIDDTWVPIDPLMTAALVRWGLLDGGAWPPDRSLGAILGRLSGEFTAPTKHNGQHLMMTLPTTCRSVP